MPRAKLPALAQQDRNARRGRQHGAQATSTATSGKHLKRVQRQLEARLRGAANIQRGKTACQDYEGCIPSPTFYKHLRDRRKHAADADSAKPEEQKRRATLDARCTLLGRVLPCQSAGTARQVQRQR